MQDLNSGKRCVFSIFFPLHNLSFFFQQFLQDVFINYPTLPLHHPKPKKIRVRPLEKYKYFDSLIQNRRELTMQKRLVLSIAKSRARSSRCCGLIFAHCAVVLLKCSETLAVKVTLKSEGK